MGSLKAAFDAVKDPRKLSDVDLRLAIKKNDADLKDSRFWGHVSDVTLIAAGGALATGNVEVAAPLAIAAGVIKYSGDDHKEEEKIQEALVKEDVRRHGKSAPKPSCGVKP